MLVRGGVLSMVEVTRAAFARFFFSSFHPEPYYDRSSESTFPAGHTMLDSDQALSWMVFVRDPRRFRKLVPQLHLERRRYLPWLSYLLSGGVNLRSFIPTPIAPALRAANAMVRPLNPPFAIHWHLRFASCNIRTDE